MRELVNALDFTYAALGRNRVEQASEVGVLVGQDDAGAFDPCGLVAEREAGDPVSGQVIHSTSVARSSDAV